MFNKETATREELLAELQRVTSAKTSGGFKVTEKGGISRYGLGRFPVTLYLSQWEQVIGDVKSGTLEAFIEANRAKLAVKADKA
jgi:hypothetical protein